MKRTSLVLAALLLLPAACGGDDADPDPAEPAGDDAADRDAGGEPGGEGFVVVHMAPTDAIFTEGFEMGLRIDDPDSGEVLKQLLWSEHAASAGGDPYTSFLEQPLRAGPVRIGVDVNIGIGPPPEVPDLTADRLPCELEVEVVAGETVEVEVGFDDSLPDCARVVE